jgi:uncharacterized membrane protein
MTNMDDGTKDPSKYIWGIFYYNKEDKRLLPPKRIPMFGWTVNFANSYSVVLCLAIIAAVTAAAKLLGR